MPKTEIILTHNVVGLGAESDQVKVAAGYARNYLFPQGLAIPLTAANKRRLEALRQRRAEREAHEFNTMSELSRSLAKMVLVLTAKTGEEGKMFGSITAGVIVDELKHQFDIAIDKKKVHLERPLRAAGEHEVELRLHPEVVTTLKVRVESATPAANPAEATAEPKAKETAMRRTREAVAGRAGEGAAPKAREGVTAKAKDKDTPAAKAEATKERAPRKPRAEKKSE
ncbi:MAG TPA: 50S ribosomal protein L9 [Candidatus Angelobacter sp.]|nr:50S ribosomal protein L9 [Candidatus Angelobacter sp.]